jgi:hypothetical protein
MLCMCVWVCTSVSVESRKYLNKIPPLRLYSKPDLSCDCLVFLHWVKLCKLSISTTTTCICPLYLSHASTSVGWFSGFLKTHWVWVLQEFTRPTPILYIYIYIYKFQRDLGRFSKISRKYIHIDYKVKWVSHSSDAQLLKGGFHIIVFKSLFYFKLLKKLLKNMEK